MRKVMISKTEITPEDYTANYSALLYILTEQQVLMGRLLEELIKVGALNTHSLSRITAGTNDIEVLTHVYNEMYKDFSEYFGRVKWALAEMKKESSENEKG